MVTVTAIGSSGQNTVDSARAVIKVMPVAVARWVLSALGLCDRREDMLCNFRGHILLTHRKKAFSDHAQANTVRNSRSHWLHK